VQKEYQIESRIWIKTESGTFLGNGRVQLLQEIDKHGSISKAAKKMKMSYKKAWNLVDSMNKEGKEILVTAKSGGVGGGGTNLSQAGQNAIKQFKELDSLNRTFLDAQMNKFKF